MTINRKNGRSSMNFSKTNILALLLTMTLMNTAFGITYTCKKFGKTFTTTLAGYSSGEFDVINSSCSNLINQHWNKFGMEKKYWDDGWGFHNACSTNTPLNRTFRALELLRVSKNSNYDSSIALNYAYGRSKNWIHNLRVRCAKNAKDSAGASHTGGAWEWIGGDNGSGTVYIYQNGFSASIMWLAGTILHEARHKKKGHNGDKGCPRKASCDSSYSYGGSNAYELIYSWWYGVASKKSNIFTRQMGLDQARSLQNRAFKKRPNFNIHTTAR